MKSPGFLDDPAPQRKMSERRPNQEEDMSQDPIFGERFNIRRRDSRPALIKLSQENLVRFGAMAPNQSLPVVAQPALEGVDLAEWAGNCRDLIETKLMRHGAILFRNFDLDGAAALERFVQRLCGELMEYRERSSPRHEIGGRVYTSTDYPPDQVIFPHNEHSYSLKLPLKLFFLCVTPAAEGGETPIADTRRIYRRIAPEIRDRFFRKRYVYVRNFGDGFGVSWQTAFQTDDKAAVETYCYQNAIEFEWKAGDRLRTRQVRPAVVRHPRTGESVWFNHITFFHISTLAPSVREALLGSYDEDDLPNNTYYGDGSPIEPEVVEQLHDAYLQEVVRFRWQKQDLLLLDNMLTAHARAPFLGPRTVLFAMSDLYVRDDI